MTKVLNCLQCIHFYVTWDTNFPKGCKLFGFKTKYLPSKTVLESTGKKCENFTPRAKCT